MGETPELLLDGLSVTVGSGRRRRTILSEASLTIARGEVVAVVGPSGGGKSTLLKAILGLLPFSDGSIAFRGERASQPLDRIHRLLRREAEAVFQNPVSALNPHRTLRHTIEEPLAAAGVPPPERRRRAAETAARMGLSGEVIDRRPAAVSVGQAQRAAIARALAARPALLFLDEPLSALDAIVAHEVAELLAETIREVCPTILMVSHDLRIVRRMASRVVVVEAGRIVEDAPVSVFLDKPRSMAGCALLASDQRRRAVFERPTEAAPALDAAS
ncbi:MAG: ATP-binding cassette domain-containing protein [Pseudomonadota bacterium]